MPDPELTLKTFDDAVSYALSISEAHPLAQASVVADGDGEVLDITAHTAVVCAERAKGSGRTGFATPAMVFGPDFILELAGSKRTDV